MKTQLVLCLCFLFSLQFSFASDSTKVCVALRVTSPPKIDGKMDEEVWKNAMVVGNLTQHQPYDKQHESQKTEVRIIYTDYALYVGAMLYDTSPDSILRQLGKRDEDNLNADRFYFKIDTYHNNQDAYQFGVYASGIQQDSKFSDATFDAVWNSAVGFSKDGWCIEYEIPYSAIRFPENENQEWGLQFTRDIRRNREFDQWGYVPSSASNAQMYWGILKGISNVKTPLRLSFTPYVSANVERAPVYDENGDHSYSNGVSYSLGTDLKYGIDDRFTLDMSLLPDFGQVQSDKTVKNLSYRETVYDENRPFFKEGVELFTKGNLFYSRRIGRVPSGYYSVFNDLQPGESVEENPSQVKLLNATKISGRNDNGLGMGFFNALTDNTYAKIKSEDGSIRKVLTEPLTNYNILVLDQQFKNNSDIYLVNTNTLRSHDYVNADVGGGGVKISNKKSTYLFSVEGFLSKHFQKNADADQEFPTGFKYKLGAEKLGGNISYGIYRTVINPDFNTNDLGYFTIAGQNSNYTFMNFNRYTPWHFIRESYNTVSFEYDDDYKTGRVGFNEARLSLFANNLNYISYYVNTGFQPVRPYDYYEPRTPGRVFHGIRYWYFNAGISSDYRKVIAVDYGFNVSNFIDRFVSEGYNHDLSLRIRATDKLFIKYDFSYYFDPYNLGFANYDDNGNIIFGLRRLYTYINQLSASYIFVKDMSISLVGRHYWNTGKYRHYYTLEEDGELTANEAYSGDNDFNFNVMNIDVVYEWRFSPGSVLDVIYKNGVENETGTVHYDFGRNLNYLFNAPQTNTFAVKFLYYLDYLKLKRRHS